MGLVVLRQYALPINQFGSCISLQTFNVPEWYFRSFQACVARFRTLMLFRTSAIVFDLQRIMDGLRGGG